MSGLDDLLSQIPTSDIADRIGADEADVDKAVRLLVPVLVGGLHENAQNPDHAGTISSAADDHAASGLLDGGVSLEQVDQSNGQQAVARIFGGHDSAKVAGALAGESGVSGDLLKQLLPILAPIVLAYIGKQLGQQGGSPAPQGSSGGALNDVLGSILGEMAGGNKSLGSVLGNVLGSKAGDILGGLFGKK